MKNWQETSAVLERAAELSAAGRRCALATVTAIEGSAYRRPGAKLLVDDEGVRLGGVSGGCLEADVRELGLAAIADGEPRLRHYDTGGDEDVVWGLGLGCNGAVDVLVRRVDPEDPALDRARVLLEGDRPFALATVLAGGPVGATIVVETDGATTGTTGSPDLDGEIAGAARSRLESGATGTGPVGDATVFFELPSPPPRLVLFGAGDDAIPLARLGSEAGFRVTVVDHRPAFATRERFPAADVLVRRPEAGLDGIPLGPDAWAVVLTHALERDRAWIERLLESEVPYVGALGPRDRREEIAEAVGAKAAGRLHGPVGLDVGAEGPEQIAVSVIAEILALRSGRAPGHLKDRDRPIHGSLPADEKAGSHAR
jgi:xanthine dehydrogenase accessory factor